MKTIGKKIQIARIISALFAAFFISINGRWNQIGEALASPSFYVVVMVSFLIAYLILLIIHIANRVLNWYFYWTSNPDKPAYLQSAFYKRIILQFIFCVMLPISVDVLFAGILIEATGRDFWTSGYLNDDFPIVVAFILFFNGNYIFNHFVFIRPNFPADTLSLTESHLRGDDTYMNLDLESEILCLIKEGKQISLITTSGDELNVNDTLQILQEQFKESNIYRINRSTFINANTILGYRFGNKRRTVEIILKSPYTHLIDPSRKEFLIVTGAHVPLIREQFDRI
ncbi:LytTR family transcriptional regulator DNA-binding domain-containing protein [Sphingobacterium spiritivorum]|uniref:LytTR family transcriptional regulator DNA-binding domain-containing protein n=1 Tax=Sphingobacterium spiritivorum TaxID=258 RepID=UPI003DA2A6ED